MVERTAALAIQVAIGENGAVLQRRQRDSNGIVVIRPLDAGPVESMRIEAKAKLRSLPKTVAYSEIDLQKMDELRTHRADKLIISKSGVVV